MEEEWLQRYIDKPWNWDAVSGNINLGLKWIKYIPFNQRNFDIITKVRNFDISWVSVYPNANWNVDIIFYHPMFNLSWFNILCKTDVFIRNLEYITHESCINCAVQKNYTEERNMFFEKCYREYNAAYKIQQHWYHNTVSPEYAIGRKFINRTYDALLV